MIQPSFRFGTRAELFLLNIGILTAKRMIVAMAVRIMAAHYFLFSRFNTFPHQVRLLHFGHFKYRVVPMCIAFNASE
jgi:ABC-type multidrug transport system permease subunit